MQTGWLIRGRSASEKPSHLDRVKLPGSADQTLVGSRKRAFAVPAQYGNARTLPFFRILQGVLQCPLKCKIGPWNSYMNSVKIEETHAVDHPFLRERMEKGKRPGTREFVALIDGVEAGLLIFEHFPNGSWGLVYEIYVLREFRAIGVGNLLLSHAETIALDSACKTLRLMARSLDQEFIDDENLASWYGRKGFNRDASAPGWMRKNLASASTRGGRIG